MIGPAFSSRPLGQPRAAKRFAVGLVLAISASLAMACGKPVYLTLDTGGMQSADLIAGILKKHQVKATFFLANEKTYRGDFSIDENWQGYWRARVAEGHAFGSHTLRHGRILETPSAASASADVIRYRPQFGADAGKLLHLTAKEFCAELRAVDQQFQKLTGRPLDPIWRAPGGFTNKNALQAAEVCGYTHIHWSPAGFLGDELASERYPNAQLLKNALRDIRTGDILMAHLGIWSRKETFAPMLDPLIEGLKSKGFCFKTIIDRPSL